MNVIKQLEREVGALWQQVRDDVPGRDQRALELARDQLQDGFMWLVRAVARPADQFGEPHRDRETDR